MNFRIIVVLLALFILAGCGKKKDTESPKSEYAPSPSMISGDALDNIDGKEVKEEEKKGVSRKETQKPQLEQTLGKTFFPVNETKDRYIEYSISLSYECKDLIQTRKDLLGLISKFGFMEYSNPSITTNS